MSLAACHKDKPEPVNPSDTPQQEEIPVGEGIYNPAAHITSLSTDDGSPDEIWVWENRKLKSINSSDGNGGSTPTSSFTYNGWRLSQANTIIQDQLPAIVSYSYANDKLSSMAISSQGMPMATADVLHVGERITHLDLNVSDVLIQMIVQMVGQGGLGGFDFGLGPQMNNSIARIGNALQTFGGQHSRNGKFSISSTDIEADLTWEGDNVSRMIMTAEVVMGVTVEELQQILPLDSIMGAMASLLAYVSAGQELPLTLTVVDTTDMSYDSHNNPVQGFFGRLDPSILSANNVTALNNHGMMNLDLTITIPFLGDQHIPYSMPLGEGVVQTYSYTYNAAGFPATMEDNEGFITTYNYQEQ